MATRRIALSYQVYLTDPTQVAVLQAQYPNGRVMAPDDAATEYAAPIQLDTAAFSAPCIRSIWFQTQFNYPRSAATFTVGSGSLWSIITGSSRRHWWVAQFVYANGTPNTQGTTALTDHMPSAIRYSACGFELLEGPTGTACGEGPTCSAPGMATRAASRLPGGYGLSLRGDNGRWTMPTVRNSGGTAPRATWTRLYACRRSNAQGYLLAMTNASGRGIFLQLLDGVMVIRDGSSGTPTAIGTIADALPNLDEWVRFDILLRWGDFGSGDAAGQVDILKNGEHKFSITTTATGPNGFTVESGANAIHTQSDLGFGGTNDAGFAVDVDDWVISAFPGTNGRAYNAAVATVVNDHHYYLGSWYKALTAQTGSAPAGVTDANWLKLAPGIDFANGSHIARVSPKALSASDTGWAGDVRLLQQQPGLGAHLQGRTSSTSGAISQVTTDFAERVLNRAGFLGVASFTVATYANRGASANDGTVGYKLGAAAAVNGTIAQTTSPAYGRLMYRPAGASAFTAISALELLHTKGADTGAATCYSLHAAVEMIGNFAEADIPHGSTVTAAQPTRMGAHLSHIPISQWVQQLAAPIGPVLIKSGTYVGNGTGQDLTFAVPPTFMLIRALTSDAGGVWWYPSMLGPHHNGNEGESSVLMPEVRENIDFAGAAALGQADFQYYVRLAGSNSQINANGVTYQYVAVCDPAARFLLAQAGAFDSTYTSGFPVRLQNPDFVPEGVLAWGETPGGNTTLSKRFRGPGHTGNQASETAANVLTTAMSMAAGVVTLYPSLNGSDGRTQALLCVRSNDGSGDPGVRRVVEVQTWTGTGSASRDVLIPGSTGRRPLLVMVWSHDTSAFHWRDPSHTTNTASRYDGASSTTAITAGGLDQFTVGATLNANGVVYNALIILGGTTAGNAGWSAVATEETPVEPAALDEGDYDDLTDEEIEEQGFDPDTGEEVDEEPGDADLDPGLLDTDVATDCVQASTRLVNLALSRIGVSKTVSNLATDNSQEAASARTVYKTELDATLRDFPWPFATRYDALVLVDGDTDDPVNGDWTYSYRPPADSLLVRRIVNPNDKRETRDEIPFKMGADDDGDLLHCDEPGHRIADGEDVTVEYTARIPCPARRGDAIFRSAAAWRLAAALVEPLGRDAKKAEWCTKQYLKDLIRARAVHLNEQSPQQLESSNDAEWISGRG